ncbi:Cys-tRNA(Pro) deacylase [Isoptericola chiayiensis]|uniref:Cys-tRNA(Pro)/Cys-tRNA(Cys) deacylase n=1 Tax=Isoptericola chiayiensis TaxID=579446 RepID=A0ABP8YQV0_9MICO|nr:Cys-tRNA(Pro) deacylase [Isoptericola chiayiensis]NOW01836.1 Cys-tRNA(Pro)/Cys-tRNA(Cys) deacylase [Isoptericola chiayiensis]
MARHQSAASTPAVLALARAGVAHELHPYEHDPRTELSYGLEAAAALGVPAEQVFKTLMTDVDGELVVAVVPVTGSLDLKALARAVGGKKAAMAPVARAERATGYVAGGISPLGQRGAHRTVLDASAADFDAVFVSGGRRGLDVSVAPDDLVRLTDAVVASVAR